MNHKIQREGLGLLFGLAIGVVIVEVISAILIHYCFKNWDDASNFGEAFGAVNSLFSGLALAGIVYTLWLQKKALEEQRLQFLKADEESLRTQDDRAKTHEMLFKQVEALNRTVEIQAIQLYIQHLAEQIKSTHEKKQLTAEKEYYFARLKYLLEEQRPR